MFRGCRLVIIKPADFRDLIRFRCITFLDVWKNERTVRSGCPCFLFFGIMVFDQEWIFQNISLSHVSIFVIYWVVCKLIFNWLLNAHRVLPWWRLWSLKVWWGWSHWWGFQWLNVLCDHRNLLAFDLKNIRFPSFVHIIVNLQPFKVFFLSWLPLQNGFHLMGSKLLLFTTIQSGIVFHIFL